VRPARAGERVWAASVGGCVVFVLMFLFLLQCKFLRWFQSVFPVASLFLSCPYTLPPDHPTAKGAEKKVSVESMSADDILSRVQQLIKS
jgi:hypothetical protein